MSTIDSYGIAQLYLQRIILTPGQYSGKVRVDTVQTMLDAAGFDAVATCAPEIATNTWPSPCAGPDGDQATYWLVEITEGARDVLGLDTTNKILWLQRQLDERIVKRHP